VIDVAGGHWRKIVRTTGLGTSFMGSMFLALTTSLPKIVASVAALAFYDPVNVREICGSNLTRSTGSRRSRQP
jgi:Ca2+/Na+ antiporter